jgi:hypothetical protein
MFLGFDLIGSKYQDKADLSQLQADIDEYSHRIYHVNLHQRSNRRACFDISHQGQILI